MLIQSAEVTKDHVIVVLEGLKSISGHLKLEDGNGLSAVRAYMTDAHGNYHQLSEETLRSLKPEIRSWLNNVLSKKAQTVLSTPGAHIRLTAEESKAALLFRVYRHLPE